MKLKSKKGAVLVYVILVFCLLTILGGGMITLTNHNTRMTQTEMRSEQAYQSALSGLEYTLDSFVQDPAVGEKIAQEIQAGGTPTSKLELGDLGSVKIVLSCVEGSPCTKIQVDSSATVKGLTKSVVGYLLILDKVFEKPINLVTGSKITMETVGKDKPEHCLFPETNGNQECFDDKTKGELEFDAITVDNKEYNKFIDTQRAAMGTTSCNAANEIKASCVLKPISNQKKIEGKITVDNSKNDVYINIDPTVIEMNNVTLAITDPDSDYLVTLIVPAITIRDSTIGNSERDADNILILSGNKTQSDIKQEASTKGSSIFGWIVNPYGSYEMNGTEKTEVNNVGGFVVNKDIIMKGNSGIRGIQMSLAMMALLVEAGIEPPGEGGAMNFAKTYAK